MSQSAQNVRRENLVDSSLEGEVCARNAYHNSAICSCGGYFVYGHSLTAAR